MARQADPKFIVIKTKGTEAVYVTARLSGHSWLAPYEHPHGDQWLSLLYAHSSSPQLSDQQLIEIGKVVWHSYLEGHRAGGNKRAAMMRKLLELE